MKRIAVVAFLVLAGLVLAACEPEVVEKQVVVREARTAKRYLRCQFRTL
jgi:hypothetical protein